MHKYLWLLIGMLSACMYGQNNVTGKVTDDFLDPIPHLTVGLDNQRTQTDNQGQFTFSNLAKGTYTITFFDQQKLIYQVEINIPTNNFLDIVIPAKVEELDELTIHTTHAKTYNETIVSNQQIINNYAGSLASSLKNIAGVQSSDIGSGNSKPIIRGLGLNRVAVSENGIKQEGQQWGADHGLEIDALQTEKVNIIKGVGAIAYGGDAIGGVVKINNDSVPAYQGFSGAVLMHGQTVNENIGLAASTSFRKENHFLKAKFSVKDYADYKIPTNQIRYLNTNIPIDDGRLKNTAGQEQSVYLQGGFFNEKVKNILSLSFVGSKAGFFPGAHGIPSVDAARQDGDFRNVGFPYQQAKHYKLINQTEWYKDNYTWSLNIGLQHNHRQEWSKFHTHYSNQIKPEKDPDLELDFRLTTTDVQAKVAIEQGIYHQTEIGLQHNYQTNRVAGYSFLLPEYSRNNIGLFAQHHWDITPQWQVDAGLRLDYTQIDIEGFFDPILFDYFTLRGYPTNEASEAAQRSGDLNESYIQPNFAIGTRYRLNDNWATRATFSTNFRTPTAIELAANGIHHGAFRHEKGNPNLNPERGLSAEIGVQFEKNNWTIDWNPYVYYFQNYIYLRPSGEFSPLPHGGQIYAYDESEALLYGFEWVVKKNIDRWSIQATLEYLSNKQISNGNANYPLPFTPPISAYGLVEYAFEDRGILTNTSAQASMRWANEQSEIARNERVTPSYTTFGLMFKTQLSLKKWSPEIQLRVDNLLDEKYYNHASFYRPIEIPEMGRNIQLIIKFKI